ncbi:hypothetical protein KXX11_004180, partial [Aspergillus fumigatus]
GGPDPGHHAPSVAVPAGRRHGRAGRAPQAVPAQRRFLCPGRPGGADRGAARTVSSGAAAPVCQPGRHDLPAGAQRFRRRLPGPGRGAGPDPFLHRRHRGAGGAGCGPGRAGPAGLPARRGARGGDPLQPLAGARVRRLRRGLPAHRDRARASAGLRGAQHRPARRHGRGG